MHSGASPKPEPDFHSWEAADGPGPAPSIREQAKPGKIQNILIISSAFPPRVFGGAEIAAYNRAKLLAARGHQVSVLTMGEHNMPTLWNELSPEGFRLYRMKTPRRYTLFERTRQKPGMRKVLWHFQDYFDKRNNDLIAAVLDSVKPDHIEIDNIMGLGFNALTEIARRDIPVLYILHDLNLACFNTGMIRKDKPCKRQCASCRGIAVLRQASLNRIPRLGFVSPSHANLERARRFIPAATSSPSCVIRNAPEELPPVVKKNSSHHVRLLFVGRLYPLKGIEFLLYTLDALSGVYDFHLTVLGTGPSEQQLRIKYRNKKWVSFRGFVSNREVAEALMQSDLYCIPSLVVESYGLVTAQALRLGTPVIGSNTGGTAELVRDCITGMLVPPGDMKAWRDAFLKIFSNREILSTWSENALRHAGEFDADVIGQAYEEFSEKLIAQPNGNR